MRPPTAASPYLLMLSGSVAFSVMTTLAHALHHQNWQLVALARSALAFLFAVGLAWSVRGRLVFWGTGILWMRSFAGSAALLCTFYCLTRLPPTVVTTLTSTMPVWLALLAWLFLGVRPSAATWVSVAVAFLGVVLVLQPQFARGDYTPVLALVAAFFSAVAMLGLNRLGGVDAHAVVAHFAGVATVACVLSFFVFAVKPQTPDLGGWEVAALAGVGLTATVGQLFLTKAFAAGSPAKVSVVGLTQVAFVGLIEWAVLGRAPDPVRAAGMVLVVAPTGWLLARRGR